METFIALVIAVSSDLQLRTNQKAATGNCELRTAFYER